MLLRLNIIIEWISWSLLPLCNHLSLHALQLETDVVKSFKKSLMVIMLDKRRFFRVRTQSVRLIDSDSTSWEADILPQLASASELAVYRHEGFWQPMDTLRDKTRLEDLGLPEMLLGRVGNVKSVFLEGSSCSCDGYRIWGSWLTVWLLSLVLKFGVITEPANKPNCRISRSSRTYQPF